MRAIRVFLCAPSLVTHRQAHRVHLFSHMLNTVKEIIYTVGDSTGAFAKSLGLTSADIAKILGAKSADLAKTVGATSADLAKTVGSSSADIAKAVGVGTVALAKRIGPKRALIGAAVLAVAVGGGIVLVRYLRRREQEELDAESMEASDGASTNKKIRDPRMSRAERRAVNAANALR